MFFFLSLNSLVMALMKGHQENQGRGYTIYLIMKPPTGIDSLSVLQQKLQLPDADLWDFNKSEPGRGVRSPPIPDPTALSV